MRKGGSFDFTDSDVIRHAHLEYKVTRQISTGNGELYCTQWRPTRGFIGEELGFGVCAGPSLLATLAQMPEGFGRAGGLTPQQNRARLQAVVSAPSVTGMVARKRRSRADYETAGSRKAKRENKFSRHAAIKEIEASALRSRAA